MQRWYHGTACWGTESQCFPPSRQRPGIGRLRSHCAWECPWVDACIRKNGDLASTPAQVRRLLGQQCRTVIKPSEIRVCLLNSGLVEHMSTSSAHAMLPCAHSVHSLVPLSAQSWFYHSLFHSVVVLCAWLWRLHSFDFLCISEPLAIEEKGRCSLQRFGYRTQGLKTCFLPSLPLPGFLSFPCLLVWVVGVFCQAMTFQG